MKNDLFPMPKWFFPILVTALIVVLSGLLTSCSPEKKLNRLLMKYPELRTTDTIHDTVEAIVSYVHTDTVFKPTTGDTVRLSDGRLRVKYVRMPGDTVYLAGECLADTVRVPVETIVERVAPKEYVDRIPWWVWLIICMLVALIALPRVTTAISVLRK